MSKGWPLYTFPGGSAVYNQLQAQESDAVLVRHFLPLLNNHFNGQSYYAEGIVINYCEAVQEFGRKFPKAVNYKRMYTMFRRYVTVMVKHKVILDECLELWKKMTPEDLQAVR